MTWFLYLISILWIAVGSLLVLYTNNTVKIFKILLLEDSPKYLGVLPLTLGVLLTISAKWSGAFYFILILGLLGIIKGILLFIMPPQKTRSLIKWWFNNTSENTHRLWGLILIVLGIFIFTNV